MITQDWHIVPTHDIKHKNAIFFAISDDYSFAVANLLMGLYKHSKPLMQTVDVLIYHNGLSDKNKTLLRSLHKDTYFILMQFPNEWADMLIHPKTARWGAFVIGKLFGFELIKRYEKVLHLDADMHLRADITELFQIEEAIAWRSVIAWDPNEVFASLLPPDTPIRCGNGGLLLFTEKLAKYSLDIAAIQDAFLATKDLTIGGVDETILAWLVHTRNIPLKELDMTRYNTPSVYVNPDTRLVHFLDFRTVSSKPWVNLASYLYYEDWAENHQAWLRMGGEGLVRFSKDDYYGLFGYDKAIQIRKLKQTLARLREENATQRKESERQQEEIATLRHENEQLSGEINDLHHRLTKQEKRLSAVLRSKSWQITKPFRRLWSFGKRVWRGNRENKKP